MTALLLSVAALVALGNWAAVQARSVRAEYILKPATLALLLAAAVAGGVDPWAVAALAFGLVGDIGLMLASSDDADAWFLGGLGSFLLGHICYVVAFARHGLHPWDVLAGALVVAGISALALPRVLRGAAAAAGRPFAVVVAGYALVLAAMAALAIGTGAVTIALGGVLFLVSDTIIAWERFVRPVRSGPLAIIATYHLAQFLLVLGLARSL